MTYTITGNMNAAYISCYVYLTIAVAYLFVWSIATALLL